jgi:hypothetical protein
MMAGIPVGTLAEGSGQLWCRVLWCRKPRKASRDTWGVGAQKWRPRHSAIPWGPSHRSSDCSSSAGQQQSQQLRVHAATAHSARVRRIVVLGRRAAGGDALRVPYAQAPGGGLAQRLAVVVGQGALARWDKEPPSGGLPDDLEGGVSPH